MLKIYFMLKAQYIKTAMAYTLNFWMMFISGIVSRTLMMGVAFVLFRNMPTVAGFTESEVYLMMALMFLSEGICNIFFDGIWHVPSLVHNGQFDVMLARPVPVLYQVLSYEIGLQGLGIIAMGVVSLMLSARGAGFLTLANAPLLLLFIACGTTLRMSTYLIGVCVAFFMDAGGSNQGAFTLYSLGEYAKYPVNIYPGFVQGVLFSAIPFAFIGYVPVLIFKGERALMWIAALIAASALYFFIAKTIFYRGIDRYESMGM